MSCKHANELYRALHQRYFKQIKHLIQNEGVSVNYQFPDGSFPLHIAAEKHDTEIVKFLLSFNASTDYKNRHGETALMIAINNVTSNSSCVAIHIVSALVNKQCRVNLCDSQGRTALHLACSKGMTAIVKILINSNARVNSQDKWSRNPMHMTLLNVCHDPSKSIANYFQIVKILLTHKCEINHRDRHAATPLFLAVSCGDHCLEIARLLIACGAHSDQVSRHGLTPLMLAVKRGFYEMSKLLIQFNCNVNRTYKNNGKSMLYTACYNGYDVIAKILVASGCDLNCEKWLYDGTLQQMPNWTNYNQDLHLWLILVSQSPLSLKELSRTSIRKSMKSSTQKELSKLQYPQVLKGYILLENVFQEAVNTI